MSLLSWERGLKYDNRIIKVEESVVAPLVGAWIEIATRQRLLYRLGRSSRGSVD